MLLTNARDLEQLLGEGALEVGAELGVAQLRRHGVEEHGAIRWGHIAAAEEEEEKERKEEEEERLDRSAWRCR